MKVPRSIMSYCPRCNKHTVHTVALYRGGQERTLSKGRRRVTRKREGYGSSREPVQKRKAKVTKKQTLKLTCKECKYITHREGVRLKKIEVVELKK